MITFVKIIISSPERLMPRGFDYSTCDCSNFERLPVLMDGKIVGHVSKKTDDGLECMIYAKAATIEILEESRLPTSVEIELL